MSQNKFAITLRLALILFFLLPLVYFIYKFKFQLNLDANEFLWALKNSLVQSGVASLITLLLALPMSLALLNLRLNLKLHAATEKLLLLPQIIPIFYTLLILFTVFNPFPRGLVGIIMSFVFVNLGLMTVLLAQAIGNQMSSYSAIADVYSISKKVFYLKIFFPMMWIELFKVFLLIFAFCFSSFSIPLVVGNGQDLNLEILVYEKIFIESDWNAAFNLSVLQTIFIFILSWISTGGGFFKNKVYESSRYLSSRLGIGLILIYLSLYILGYLWGLLQSFSYLEFIKEYYADILISAWLSFKILFLTLGIFLVILYFWLYDFVQYKSFNFATHFISLSTVVTGFAIYLFFPSNSSYDYIKLMLAFCFLLFPVLFKLYLQTPVESLRNQIQIAEVLGVSRTQIILQVILKQIYKDLSLWVSVVALWVVSDFAISKAVGLQMPTLGLLSHSFLSSYRLPVSYLLSAFTFIFVFIFLLMLKYFLKVIYVVYKKFSF